MQRLKRRVQELHATVASKDERHAAELRGVRAQTEVTQQAQSVAASFAQQQVRPSICRLPSHGFQSWLEAGPSQLAPPGHEGLARISPCATSC
eukprot:COSAG01_NODE_628_length_14690_cov_1156.936947_6_plen_93_part_00